MRTIVLAPLLGFLLPGVQLWARQADIVKPAQYQGAGIKLPNAQRIPSVRFRLPHPVEQHFAPLTREQMEAFHPKGDLQAASLHRAFPPEARAQGSWQDLPDGRRVWRIGVRTAGAQAVRVHFTNFDVGNGRVWVHDGSGSEDSIAGPYTGRGAYGDGDFWTGLVFGEAAVIEYEPEDSASGALPFQVAEISHVFHGLEPQASTGHQAALGCHEDLACHPEYADISKSVARMVFETGEGGAYCTGALIMDRARTFTPYFLTANHCISTDTEARSLVTFWFYQTPGCGQSAPDPRGVPRANGARLLAGGEVERGDYTLLQLNETPSGVTFAGWRPDVVPVGTKVFGIHHPAGDYKRVSIGERAEDRATSFSVDKHYLTPWKTGLTEGGSSGSPLFSDEGVIIGQLTGGPKPPAGKTGCDLMPSYSLYGKFAVAYPALQQYLEGRSGVTPPPGSSGGNTLGSGAARDWSYNVNSPTLFNGNSGFKIDVPSGATALNVVVTSTNRSAEVLLVARNGTPPSVADGRVQADATVEMKDGRAVLRLDANSSPPIRPGTWHIALAIFTTGAVSGNITATVETGSSTPPPSSGALSSGVPQSFSLPAVTVGTLFNGNAGFRINVPDGATKLEVKVATATPNADVDLFVRFGQDVELSGTNAVSDYKSTTDGGNESVTITASSNPPLKAGTYYIALGLFTRGTPVNGTITATVERASAPPDNTGTLLTSGQAREISLEPVSSPRLFTGASGYRIVVPEGAANLEIRTTGSPANADVDLYVRYGSAPNLSDGRVVSDFSSSGPASQETITISGSSLKAGTYYIALGLFTTNTSVKVTLTATVGSGSSGGGSGPIVLTSGARKTFNIPAVSTNTLLGGSNSYQIAVPANARKLTIRLETATPNVDLDIYARFGTQVDVRDGRVVTDYESSSSGGNETIEITPSMNPALRAGTYYIGIGVFTTGINITGAITATVETDDTSSAPVLQPGTPRAFRIGPVSGPTLMRSSGTFKVTAPAGATKLQVRATATTPGADIDLYVRFGTPAEVVDGKVVGDYSSTTAGGDETVTVLPTSTPPLRSGDYYITLALRTTGVEVSGTVTATFETSASRPAGSTLLASGVPGKFSLPAVDQPTLFVGDYGFRVEVPEGATRLEVKLLTSTPNVDTDLYVRYGADVELGDGEAIADWNSSGDTGNETVVITTSSSKPLKPGTYYIGMGLFTTGLAADGKITATIERTPSLPTPEGGNTLEPNVETRFSFPAVSDGTLFSGDYAYKLVVPEGSTKLQVRISTATPGADVDLFVRQGTMPDVAEGRVVADYRSTSDSGDEMITITTYTTPPLKPGVYYIAMAVFTKDTPISGTIVAAILGPQNSTAVMEKGAAPADQFQKLLASPEGDQPLRVDSMRESAGEALERKPAQPAPAKPMRRLVR